MTIQAPTTDPRGSQSPDPAESGVVEATKDEAAVLADRAKHETTHLVEEARRTMRSQTDQQAGRVAASARDLARQLDDLASGRGGTDGPVASFAHDASSHIDSLAQRLETDGLDGITRDAKQFARRRPGTYLVSAFAIGIVAGRVFRNADARALAEAARPEADEPTEANDADTTSFRATNPTTAAQTPLNQEDISWPTPPKL